jgi:hypothetical protein
MKADMSHKIEPIKMAGATMHLRPSEINPRMPRKPTTCQT